MPNFKKIGSKLWPWQCPRFSDQYGGRDVINYVNELKHKRAQLDLYGTIFAKFHQNRPSSFGVLARTDRQTDRHTDRQTTPVSPDPNDYNTFSQWKWLNVKILTVLLVLVLVLDGGDGRESVLVVVVVVVAAVEVGAAQPAALGALLQPPLLVVTANVRPQALLLFLKTI